jgi:hypothetical protein
VPHGNLLERTIQVIKQNLTDQTVDAGKAAYVDSLRTALIVAVCVLATGAVGVWLLLRHATADADADAETDADHGVRVGDHVVGRRQPP